MQNEQTDASQHSQSFTDPVRPSDPLRTRSYSQCSSRQSSIDSLVDDSDWSDTSFYPLPSFKTITTITSTGPPHIHDISDNSTQGNDSRIFPHDVQQNVSIAKPHQIPLHSTNKPKKTSSIKGREYHQYPVKAMDRSDYSDIHISPDSDDTIGRSSSGIASDLESPRSPRSSFVETPRGLARSVHSERELKQPVGVRSLDNTRSVVPPMSRSFHVQSNIETDDLLLGLYKNTGIPHGMGTPHTGIPYNKGSLHSNTGIPLFSDTGIPHGKETHTRIPYSKGSLHGNTGIPHGKGTPHTGIPCNKGSLHSNTGIPSRSNESLFHDTGNPHDNVRITLANSGSMYSNTGIPPRTITNRSFQSNTGIPIERDRSFNHNTGIPKQDIFNSSTYLTNYTGIPRRNDVKDESFVNMYSDTGILKQYDKISVKNLSDKMTTGHMVLNNGVRSSELGDPWTRRKVFAMNNSRYWKHTGLMNSFSMEASRHIAPSVWAMKLVEMESTPTLQQELLLKARLFRRWHQRARLQRLDRIENENKMNKAVEFWRNNAVQKHFVAWRKNKREQQSKAEKVYRRHMLETGFKGLQFAVQVNNQAESDIRKRVDSKLLAKFWLKWQSQLDKKKTENLRSAFNRWRVLHLEGNRDKILEGIADKHIMTKSYIKWKIKYSVEQNNSIAKLNFQISLLTKCWHSWRIYAAQRVVKTRTNEVARIHYQNYLQVHVFKVWMDRRKHCSVANNLLKRRIIVKAFYSWRNWTQYAKVIHQRFQSMCKEYYSRALLKQSFVKWKQRLMMQQAINYHSRLLQKRVYRLWFLRYRRNVIHRHLCKAMARKGKKRRFFRKWLNITQLQCERRQQFVAIFHKILLSKMMFTWKLHTRMKTSLKERLEWIMQKKSYNCTRLAMEKWLFAIKVVNFKKQARINWTNRCVKNACNEWKMLLKRKALEQTLIESRPERDLWMMRVFWNTWRKKKEAADKEQEHVKSVAAILTRNFKRRIFIAWRVTNQQEQIIAPTVARRQRKMLARVFDAWRLHIYRQKYIVDQQTRAEEKLVDKHFLHWKERASLQIKGRNAVSTLQFSKMARAFMAWKGHIRDIRHQKLKERAEKLKILSSYFKQWTQKFAEQIEAREEEKGREARNQLLVRWVFKHWQRSAESKRQRLQTIEEQVVTSIRYLKLRRCMDVWMRWYKVAEIARVHQEVCQQQLMRKVLHGWSGVIKEELNAQLNRFSTNLALDCSMGSNAASQLFRSATLDSNPGSLLRSTLDSTIGSQLRSTMDSSLSDYLSSGYWTTRRGSGSVFPVRNPSQRDDDVASLPGRFDQIQPDSPRFRSASPITLIRESNNVAHVTPPFANGQTPTSSPSPSPPELHLSLATSTESTDSVFSPVRERGSISLRNEFERRHSSMDDDEFDSMSITSGISTASVRDREMVIIDTIRHWRSLPLSKTFRSWLKYTRQKKLLRELLYYAKERKTQEIVKKTFQKWRRELYTTVASRQFWLSCTRLRCLRAWHDYVEHRQLRQRSFESAQTLDRSMVLTRFFNVWRTKYTAKMRLQNIVGQWQKRAIVTEQHKVIEEKIHSQHSQRSLRQSFHYWVLMTRKSQEAKRHYLDRLLPKSFLAWFEYSSTHASNCRKSTWFKEQRMITMAFREWRKRFENCQIALDFVETKEIELSVDILKTWHVWATGVCTRRRLWRSYHKSLQIKTMKHIFTAWLGHVKRREIADNMYQNSLLRSVLLSWQEVCHSAKQNKNKATVLKSTCENILLRKSFTFWHQLFIHSQLAVNHSQQRDQALLKECFEEWREFTLTAKADKHYIRCMLKKVYYQWYDKCLARKKARKLIRSWKNIAEDSKTLNSKAMEICQMTDKKILHQTFMFWMQETHKIQKAKHHYAFTTCKSSLHAWYNYAHTKVRCRTVLAHVEAAKSKALLLESFSTWKNSFERQVMNQEILEDYLNEKETQLLQTCLKTWIKYTLNCRSQKHHDAGLVIKSFQTWRLRLSQKKGLQKVMEKVFYRRIRQTAMHWKQWTIKTKQQQARADEHQVNVGDCLVRHSFTYWLAATEKSRRAKEMHRRKELQRFLSVWKKVIDERVKERKKIEKFQTETMGRKVAMAFKQWQSMYWLSQKHNELVEGQIQRHNKLMLQGCMQQWLKFLLKCRADRHYDIVLVARFFLEWKIRFDERLEQKDKEQIQQEKAVKHYNRRLSRLCFRSWYLDVRVEKHLETKQQQLVEKHFKLWHKKSNLKTIASELGDQQTYAKYWSKWRNQLVRKRVAELMMKHEEKKMLSEIFGAWYKLTMIQRRLLKEWNIAVTEKWFRRWMQKYNES